MFTDFNQLAENFLEVLNGISPVKGFLFVVFFLVICFLPSIIAYFLNRKHFAKIFAANVPATLSWLAWIALLTWAITGKVRNKKEERVSAAKDRAGDVNVSEREGITSSNSH
ncbi:superinfection immunity protein [Microbulbifer epialgicus]|uniref:Superinfection immunity protein n=1 Tax=Microbulbifer epialgicus TaxID=393907 RepID=A0ABV4P656_9GAMM